MTINRRTLLGAAVATAAFPRRQARAQAANLIRIGALTDMSGPYRDVEGPTGTACALQAAEEFMRANPDVQVEILRADHQNKPDNGAAIVRQWFDRDNVDALIQVGNTAVALAVNTVARDKDKVHVNTGALSSSLTGQYCSPNLASIIQVGERTCSSRRSGSCCKNEGPDIEVGSATSVGCVNRLLEARPMACARLRLPSCICSMAWPANIQNH